MSAANDFAAVRRRKVDILDEKPASEYCPMEEIVPIPSQAHLRGKFWLTRIVILRYIAFIYFVAFLVALHQNKQLLGLGGLLPVSIHLNDISRHFGNDLYAKVNHAPTLLWLVGEDRLDDTLDYIAYTGMGLSLLVLVIGGANWFIMTALWVLYHSLVNVGQTWYSFGWESHLLESGFLVIFLCPVWSLEPINRDSPPSTIVLWAHRWLIFRIMIGAGLIKIRGDKCWRDLTCMNYHYETQPVPNPISYYLHQTPEIWHKFEVLSNHFVELVAPFLVMVPGLIGRIGGIIQIQFQVVLVISGNLSFLNWLTILPSLACFDDAFYSPLFSNKRNSVKAQISATSIPGDIRQPIGSYIRRAFNISLGILLAYLSIPVIMNLLSSRQAMNTSFNSLRIVNTYGAFGSITKKRTEVILQGTTSTDPYSPDALWEDYEFKCKPGNITRRPCLISPYHYRLDWLMWFAAFQSYQHNPWLVHLSVKLLVNDPGTTDLIAHNPFAHRDPPKYIRAEHYRYSYTTIGSKAALNGKWWKRKYLGNYMPPLSLDNTRDILKQFGWKDPRLPA